jgi:preprotein translocase subunit YajC
MGTDALISGGMTSMFITPAYAQSSPLQGFASNYWWVPYIAVLGIMYFLILRPHQARIKAQRDMISGIKRGDTVVTAGGLIGKVTKVFSDAEVQVELSEGMRVRVVRATIAEVRTRGDVREAEGGKQSKSKDGAANDDDKAAPSGKHSQKRGERPVAANDADAADKPDADA